MKSISLTLLFIVSSLYAISQGCVMCSATLETAKQEGGLTGAGINMGVAYLSFFPYLMLGFFAFLFYRAYKKDKQQNQ